MRIPNNEEYLNEFHKQWNEACMKERERTQSMTFTWEYLRTQSKRLDALVKRNDLIEMLEGKKRRRKELTDEEINKRIDELTDEIARYEEILRRYREERKRKTNNKNH